MKPGITKFICHMLMVCLAILPVQTVRADMIGTEQAVSVEQAGAARAAVTGFIDRADVAAQLQVLGLTAQSAKDRVAALTDTEVAMLSDQTDRLPAGASSAVAIAVIVVVIGLIIWWAMVKHS